MLNELETVSKSEILNRIMKRMMRLELINKIHEKRRIKNYLKPVNPKEYT